MNASGITRAYDAKVDVSEGERAVVARVNTGSVDRYGTVIDPKGVDLKAYRTNPVVLWEHGRDVRGAVPIGRNAWVKYDKAEDALLAKTVYHDDEFSDGIFRLYQNRVLRGFSVNVLPDLARAGKPTPDELRARPELADAWMVYRASELGEYSSVAVPGNKDALALAVSRGLWMPRSVRLSARDDGPTDEGEETPGREGRFIKKVGDKYIVYSEDGKKLGEHDTREEAEKQLEAVEAHKDKDKGGRSLPEVILPPLTGRTWEQAARDLAAEARAARLAFTGEQAAAADLRRGVV